MTPTLSELDRSATPLGQLTLRRRRAAAFDDVDIHEVLLNGQLLMSSLVNVSEVALAVETLARVDGSAREVLIGGLGLGYTAVAALDTPGVASVTVVESLPAVVQWFRRGLVPLAAPLGQDERARIIEGDFFAFLKACGGDGQAYDAILVDIDDSPRHLLTPSHAPFYTPDGLRTAGRCLKPGGVLAIWSAESPDNGFTGRLRDVFDNAEAIPVTFTNPLFDAVQTNTIYLARRQG
ncbi:MAG: spermidine synthase [Planctomycetes bacterium]|nr:spermidine synthase [Planctomycetota bacterium]